MKLRRLLTDESGNTLIIAIIVCMIVGSLVALSLESGRQADWSSASDRNHEGSLGAAEAGIHQQLSAIEALAGTPNATNAIADVNGSTAEGPYVVRATRCPATDGIADHAAWCSQMAVANGYVLDATASVGKNALKRQRHVRIALLPPELFPGPDSKYTIFSNTSIDLGNGDSINHPGSEAADVWANDSVTLENGVSVNGSITSAQSWIDSSAAGTKITGNVWSGGYNPDPSLNWAMNLGEVDGWAKASVTAPTDPQTCGQQPPAKYTVQLGSVGGDVTTWGSVTGGAPSGEIHQGTCTVAAPPKPAPTFTYNRYNYDQTTLHEFSSVGEFNSWVAANAGQLGSIQGTFYVEDPSPSQANRVDLTGWNIGGNVTVVTTAPIFTGGISDNGLPADVHPKLVLVSHYAPPVGSSCDVNHDDSDCAIHVKNHLNANADGTCQTATMIYADKGPVAVKNTSSSTEADMCGTVIGDEILVKNNEGINYDSSVERTLGFGRDAYEIARWEELPVS